GLFCRNVGATRRQGVEAALRGKSPLLEPWVNYAYTEATFRDEVRLGTARLTADCAAPPCTQLVRKGSELPLVPRHRVNGGVDAHLTDWLTLSLSGAYVGRQWLRGDEANAERPLGDYVVLNALLSARGGRASRRCTPRPAPSRGPSPAAARRATRQSLRGDRPRTRPRARRCSRPA